MINETYEAYSNLLMYGVMTTYAIAMFAFAVSFAQSRDGVESAGRKLGNVGMSLATLGTLLLGGAVVLRGLSAHRVPWGNMYELAITATFGVMTAMLVYSYRRNVRWLGVFITVPALLTLMLATMIFYTRSAELVPALRSYWLLIHVTAAIVSTGAFSLGATMAGLYLFAERAERRKSEGLAPDFWDGIAARVPNAERLDALSYKLNAFTFPLWTFTIIAGAIWARAAWSRYWGWDPKETWSFITWVGYAAYLHARVTVGWKGRRAAILALVAFATLIFNFTIVNLYFSGLHTYSGK